MILSDNSLYVHLYDRGTHEETKVLKVSHRTLSTPSLLVLPSSVGQIDSSVQILSVSTSSISTFLLASLNTQRPSLTLQSTSTLPLPSTPSLVMPVDPMAWSHDPVQYLHHRARHPELSSHSSGINRTQSIPAPVTKAHDALISISERGNLSFWIPAPGSPSRSGSSTRPGSSSGTAAVSLSAHNGSGAWSCTGEVNTGRTGIRLARCSSAKKTAIGTYLNSCKNPSPTDVYSIYIFCPQYHSKAARSF